MLNPPELASSCAEGGSDSTWSPCDSIRGRLNSASPAPPSTPSPQPPPLAAPASPGPATPTAECPTRRS
eukprot:364311-Chlamydomonas_euryale.AAC.8